MSAHIVINGHRYNLEDNPEDCQADEETLAIIKAAEEELFPEMPTIRKKRKPASPKKTKVSKKKPDCSQMIAYINSDEFQQFLELIPDD